MSAGVPADLDDLAALGALDRDQMLQAVASSAAQVRASLSSVRESSLDALDLSSRPRAVVVCGMGGSGISGEVLAAVAGQTCPVPVVVHRGYGLPGWVGAADLVVAASCSGTTQETLTSAAEAARRGSRLLGVGAAGSPLAGQCEQASGAFVPVRKVLSPRSSLWAMATPLLVVGDRLGLLDTGPGDEALEAAATRLELVAAACNADRSAFVNPAKLLAEELVDRLPMVWGAGQVGPVAANRMVCQLAENAKQPAVAGVLPEAHHNLVVTFAGPLAGRSAAPADDDFFRDRTQDAEPARMRLVVVRDDSDEPSSRRAQVSEELAGRHGVEVSRLVAEGGSAIERLASLVGLIDYTSVYLALRQGVDPTPIGPIDDLKRTLA